MSTRRPLRPRYAALGRRSCLVALGLLVAGALHGAETKAFAEESAPDFRVIVHPENPRRSVERRFLAQAFLKDVTRWSNDEPIHPVDLRGDSRTRSRFSDSVIKRSVAAVRSFWQQRIFSGRGVPPPEVDSDEEVVRYVLKYKGAVGYVSGRADVGKAKVVAVEYD